MNDCINGFYAGTLRPLHLASMKSFIKFGHQYKFWTYDEVKVPNGVDICDASDIVPRSLYDLWVSLSHERNLQNFANYFRYMLILKHGGWWVDTDVICIKKHDIPQDYVFATIAAPVWPELKGIVKPNGNVPNGQFKAPRGSQFLRELVEMMKPDFYAGVSPDFGQWGAIAFSKAVYRNNLQKYQLVDERGVTDSFSGLFIPFSPYHAKKMFEAGVDIPKDIYAVHFYESMNQSIVAGDEISERGSIYDILVNQ